MIYGFIAAAGWGTSTIAAAMAARRTGSYVAVLLSQGLGAAALLVAAAAAGVAMLPLGLVTLAGLAGAGLLQLAGWAAYYRALESGPIGLVSAVAACYGGITVILAVTVAREHLGVAGAAGVALAVGGVAVAAASPGRPEPAPRPRPGVPRHAAGARPARRGVPLAMASALTYGAGAFLLGRYSPDSGWVAAAAVTYATSVLVLLAALPFTCRVRALWRSTAAVSWAAAAGLTEAGALLALARGGQAGQMALTAAVSSLYPLIPLAAGVLLFREHLTRRQLLGAGCIVGGLVMIGAA